MIPENSVNYLIDYKVQKHIKVMYSEVNLYSIIKDPEDESSKDQSLVIERAA
jgi:hypothetical protein